MQRTSEQQRAVAAAETVWQLVGFSLFRNMDSARWEPSPARTPTSPGSGASAGRAGASSAAVAVAVVASALERPGAVPAVAVWEVSW